MTRALSGPDTPFMAAVEDLLVRLEAIALGEAAVEVRVTLVGGVAVHVHTAARVSIDVEACYSHRLPLPSDLAVTWVDAGRERLLRLDTNFAASIALMHPDAEHDAQALGRIGRFDVRVLTPLDLCVTKVGRWAGHDPDDVRALAARSLLVATEVDARAREALGYFVGNVRPIEHNLRDALAVIAARS